MLPFKQTAYRELSTELADRHEWHPGLLRSLTFLLDISAFAVDPIARLLAVGTTSGRVCILGGAAVDVQFENGAGIKLLEFCVSLFKLVVVDSHDRLRVWALDINGGLPKLDASTSFSQPINGLTTSPSHEHALIALRNGELRAYDLRTLSWSPHPAPNLWAAYETKLMATGALITSRSQSKEAVAVVIHPRDLGTLFVAYEGGVVLCDLTTHSMTKAYELDLPPGAPGGGMLSSSTPLSHRQTSVTALAIHPSGHVFCVGYVDGSIAFWAVDDEDKPLLCMTFDNLDVNVADPTKTYSGVNRPPEPREPIFKLAWSGFSNSSDPRGGETALTVLGGTITEDGPGVYTLWMPAFAPPEAPNTSDQQSLNPTIRDSMRKSVISSKRYFYSTNAPVQDFLLIPSSNPHFSGTFDPVALLLLYEAEGGTRALDGRQFPPLELTGHAAAPRSQNQSSFPTSPTDIDQELANTLEDMQLYAEPANLWLSPPLWSGKNAPLDPQLIKLERDPYHKLAAEPFLDNPLKLDGGVAYLENAEDTKLIKFQAHRVLITRNRDLTIRFQGLDANLLNSTDSPIASNFPRPLPELTIDVMSLLSDPAVSRHFTPDYLVTARIERIQLSPESLECVVALASGEVIVYKLKSSFSNDSSLYWEAPDKELVCLQHVPSLSGPRYYPALMLDTRRGRVSAMAMSDIGFLAVAYQDGSLYICDLRGPSIILRHSPLGRSNTIRRLSMHHKPDGKDCMASLSWTVCGLKKDLTPRVRLLTTYNSGNAHIYTIDRSSSSGPFSVHTHHDTGEGVQNPFIDPDSSVVLDSKTGLRCKADGHGLMMAMDPEHTVGANRANDRHCVWVVAGERGARATLDVNGDRLGRVEWGAKVGNVVQVRIVERTDASALVAYTDRCQALVYSLPDLEHMHTWDLPYSLPSVPMISADTTGDYVLSALHPKTSLITEGFYGTLFKQRRGFYGPPRIDLGAKRGPIPPQPQPVSMGPTSMLGSLMGYIGPRQTMSGEQADALLSGRERPPRQPTRSRTISPQRASSPSRSGSAGPATGYAMPDVGGLSQQITQGASAVFARVNNALAERGEMLDSLQGQVQSLEQGSKNMANQAKMMAAKQTAKGWFKFGGAF